MLSWGHVSLFIFQTICFSKKIPNLELDLENPLPEKTSDYEVIEKNEKWKKRKQQINCVLFIHFSEKLQNLTKALAAKSLPHPATIFAIFHPLCRRVAFEEVAVQNCVEKAVFFRSLSFPPPPPLCTSCTMTPQNPSDLCYWRGWGRNPPFNFHFFRPLRPDQPHPSATQSWLRIFR